MNAQSPPMIGTNAMSIHQPDLSRSCYRLTLMARLTQMVPMETTARRIQMTVEFRAEARIPKTRIVPQITAAPSQNFPRLIRPSSLNSRCPQSMKISSTHGAVPGIVMRP